MTGTEIVENENRQQDADHDERSFPWFLLLIGLVGIVLGIYIATQVLGILFAIISPPDAPLPANVTLVQHDNLSYGVDEWTYDSGGSPCDMIEFYQMVGGICRIPLIGCDPDEDDVTGGSAAVSLTAMCTGSQDFSIFAMRWQSSISARSIDGPTTLRIFREVLWGGNLVEATPAP